VRLTILRDPAPVPPDPEALALAALGWVLADDAHAGRFLALTGLAPDDLRPRLADRAFLAEVLDFLLRHEPDVIACAAALGVPPQALGAAFHALSPPCEDYP